VGLIRVLVVPLVAACASALFAHVAIDIAGDYLLPHDAYDDVAHGSRVLVLGIVSAILTALALGALAAAVREARGSLDAFGRTLRSWLDVGLLRSLLLALVCSTLVLVAMECVDVRTAGGAIDDVGDLFGGSLLLGVAMIAVSSTLFVFASRAVVRRLARVGGAFVRVLATVFAVLHAPVQAVYRSQVRTARSLWLSRLFGVALSGRAPPL
jgi:hypothetical protein